MTIRRPHRLAGTLAALGVLLAASFGALAAAASPAFAGTLSAASITLSNNEASNSYGAITATWSWSFVTATTASISSVDLAFGASTPLDGNPPADLGNVYGLGAGTLAWDSTDNEYVYTVTTPAQVAAGTPIIIQTDNVPNPFAGTYTGSITTNDSAGTVDSAPASYTLSSGIANFSVVIPEATSLSVSGQGIYAGATPTFSTVLAPGQGAMFPLNVGISSNTGVALDARGYLQYTSSTGMSSSLPPFSDESSCNLNATQNEGGWYFIPEIGCPAGWGLQLQNLGVGGIQGATGYDPPDFSGAFVATQISATGGVANGVLDVLVVAGYTTSSGTLPSGTYTGSLILTAVPSY